MKIFGYEISELNREELLKLLENKIAAKEKVFIVTANSLILLKTQKDVEYGKAVSKADLILPDGYGVVLAAKLKHRKDIDRYPGIELMKDLLEIGKERNWKFYLLGAEGKVVSLLQKKLKGKGINVVGFHHGYFEGEGPVDEIRSKEPDVVFVAMGVPKQELWISKNIDKFKKGIFIGVGGSFDVLSGEKKRAPRWMREHGLEWLYRTFQSPLKRWFVPFKIAEFIIRVLFDS